VRSSRIVYRTCVERRKYSTSLPCPSPTRFQTSTYKVETGNPLINFCNQTYASSGRSRKRSIWCMVRIKFPCIGVHRAGIFLKLFFYLPRVLLGSVQPANQQQFIILWWPSTALSLSLSSRKQFGCWRFYVPKFWESTLAQIWESTDVVIGGSLVFEKISIT